MEGKSEKVTIEVEDEVLEGFRKTADPYGVTPEAAAGAFIRETVRRGEPAFSLSLEDIGKMMEEEPDGGWYTIDELDDILSEVIGSPEKEDGH